MSINMKDKLIEACKSYYEGNPIMTDSEYDELYDKYLIENPNDPIIGYKPTRERVLPIPMFSLNKEKKIEEVFKWMRSKFGDAWDSLEYILTPKFDGISICVDEWKSPEKRLATKRGDGVIGQECDKHYSFMNTGDEGDQHRFISFGEAIMSKAKFRKYDSANGGMYKNARNLVGSQLNMDKPTLSILKDIDYLRYGYGTESGHITADKSKSDMIDRLNKLNVSEVPYIVLTSEYITHDTIMKFYTEWNKLYEIDGIVIEINDINESLKVGREKSMNPAYARAYKGHFENIEITSVEGITWQVSKSGKLKPVVNIESIRLSGVDVTNATGYNARYIKENGIGAGAIVSVKRSGAVIPKIVTVHNKSDEELPTRCPSCNSHLVMDDVELLCENKYCHDMIISKMTAFFDILNCKEVGRGTMDAFYSGGYPSIEAVLNMDVVDMQNIAKYAETKAKKVHTEIHKCLDGITMASLMHASCCFQNIGSSTIQLILDGECKSKVDIAEYERGVEEFNRFHESVKDQINITGKDTAKTTTLADINVVFTGFRDSALEKTIIENGGKIGNGVSAKTTHLVMAVIGSGTVKEQKAEQLGKVIMTAKDFEEMINNKLNVGT